MDYCLLGQGNFHSRVSLAAASPLSDPSHQHTCVNSEDLYLSPLFHKLPCEIYHNYFTIQSKIWQSLFQLLLSLALFLRCKHYYKQRIYLVHTSTKRTKNLLKYFKAYFWRSPTCIFILRRVKQYFNIHRKKVSKGKQEMNKVHNRCHKRRKYLDKGTYAISKE